MLLQVFDAYENQVGGDVLILVTAFDIDQTQSGVNLLLFLLSDGLDLSIGLFRTRRPTTTLSAWTSTPLF